MMNDIEALGYDKGVFYYKDRTGFIRGLTPTQHTKRNLIALAPLVLWENHFSNWHQAVDALISYCISKGVYNKEVVK